MLNGLVPFLVGLIAIIFRKDLANLAVKQQLFLTRREWPLWSFEIPYLIIGIIFVIIGGNGLLKYISKR